MKQLWIPFSYEERRPVLLEQFLYIPALYDHGGWVPVPWRTLFANDNPVSLEYCSGNGQWIAKRAKQHPERNWVAVEKRFDRSKQIWKWAMRENLKNLYIVCSEGALFSKHYAPRNALDEVYVNFPDPWPKLRHAKHRIIQRSFVEVLEPLLKPQAIVTLATDHPEYAQQMIRTFRGSPGWESLHPEPYYLPEWPNYGESFFETLWRERKCNFHYMQFKFVGSK